MKRKLIYLFIALAATILPAHAQKFLNDALTLSNVSLWQQGNSLYVGMTVDMANLTRNGKITPTTLILLGRPESTRLLDGMSPRITWTLYASNGSVTSYEYFNPPFLLAIDHVLV